MLYTDGLTDAIGATGRFGHERLLACLAKPPSAPGALIRQVTDRLDAFRHQPQTDDEAILVLQYRPAQASVTAGDAEQVSAHPLPAF